jgi:lipoprotein-anchoring transpeptidase ErfK/SrfK
VAYSRKRRSRPFAALLVLIVAVSAFAYLTRHKPGGAVQAPAITPAADPGAAAMAAPAQPVEHVQLAQTGGADVPVRTETPKPGSKPPAPAARRPDPAAATQAAAKEPAAPRATTTAPAAPHNPAAPLSLAGAKHQIEAGEFVAARDSLNAALPSLGGVELDAAKSMLSDVNQTIVFSPKRFADDTFGGTCKVQPGDVLQKIAARHNVSWELLCRLNNMSDPKRLRAGATIKVIQGPFHAVVSKSQYRLELYLGAPGGPGSMFVRSFPVGLGKSNSTPTGKWAVNDTKQKNPKFWGAAELSPMEADDPKNPLGEFWLGLDGLEGAALGSEGYGIHGTIEPDSIGKAASHGCIRLRDGDIDLVYEALMPGKSTVVIVD